jgi:hypothetical protein
MDWAYWCWGLRGWQSPFKTADLPVLMSSTTPSAYPIQRPDRWYVLGTALGLFLAFAFFYSVQGRRMTHSQVHVRDDVVFRSDTRRAFLDLAGPNKDSHHHTAAHPAFVILHHPVGRMLAEVIKGRWGGTANAARQLAALTLTSIAGGLVVMFAYLTLLELGLAQMRAVAFASVIGASSALLLMASVPETYVFSSLGLSMLTWCTARTRTGALAWVCTGAYALANLTSNAVQIGMMALARCWPSRDWKQWWLRSTLIAACAVFLLVPLSLVQKKAYPATQVFFMPSSAATQKGWFYWENLATPVHTIRVVLQHHLLSNVIAPDPVTVSFSGAPMKSIEQGSLSTLWTTAHLAVLWLAIAGIGLINTIRHRQHPPVVVAMGCSVAFTLLFFTVFGNDRMLYASIWTPPVVMLVAVGWERFALSRPKQQAWVTWPVVVLVVTMVLRGGQWIGQLLN